MPEVLTLSKLMRIKKELDAIAIKPYKGYCGLNLRSGGFFEIKTQEEFERLSEVKNASSK